MGEVNDEGISAVVGREGGIEEGEEEGGGETAKEVETMGEKV